MEKSFELAELSLGTSSSEIISKGNTFVMKLQYLLVTFNELLRQLLIFIAMLIALLSQSRKLEEIIQYYF
ncbi:hypothetical protein AB669_04510 [Pedobacter sp. BMA]|nr:hypothetical protein AB669_04510 [Pedobacter sp. BMA]